MPESAVLLKIYDALKRDKYSEFRSIEWNHNGICFRWGEREFTVAVSSRELTAQEMGDDFNEECPRLSK